MPKCDYDVITVGGGLGGSALAKVLAEKGLRVLVTEREVEFKDRIRGEAMAPWGVAEAQKLGLYQRLLETCAHPQPFLQTIGFPPRDLPATTPQKLPGLNFFHPAMQEVVIDSARAAGAEVWRGVSVRQVKPGRPPLVSVETNAGVRELTARMVVCADGKGSMGRTWGGFATQRAKQRLFGAGVMLEEARIRDDTGVVVFNPPMQQEALLFPQGRGRVRAYLVYSPNNLARLQGEGDFRRFIEACVQTGMPSENYAGVRAVAPLASFDMSEHWVDHPYRDGIALVGDAAGATDPTWGQGLSMTSRDVRVLAENLLGSDDWDTAGHAYASTRDKYFNACMTIEDWEFDFFFGQGQEADARRARALPLIMKEPDRVPDHGFSGPDLPSDDSVRRRFFGED
ncbi:MAG TPA: FAD-dependent monooxygenase [Candidatus Binataceae bacterium]|nr:FAD-dependent monooxygenase [Candidatus Binataceae bacterium]